LSTHPNDAELLDLVLGWLLDDHTRRLATLQNATALVGAPDWTDHRR
jgi:hypothetical protein